ncbi:MAG: hypothetical protein ISR90_07040 [Candidatus Marinimicrobia bacterium]|nr:hypothetical protein [Candidatus Neomarinimicrobiota bacterium]
MGLYIKPKNKKSLVDILVKHGKVVATKDELKSLCKKKNKRIGVCLLEAGPPIGQLLSVLYDEREVNMCSSLADERKRSFYSLPLKVVNKHGVLVK